MGEIASQITSLTIVYSTFYSDTDQRKHQSSAQWASNAENVSIWWRHHENGRVTGILAKRIIYIVMTEEIHLCQIDFLYQKHDFIYLYPLFVDLTLMRLIFLVMDTSQQK